MTVSAASVSSASDGMEMTPDLVQLLFLEVDVLKENGDIINVGRVVALLLILTGPGRNVSWCGLAGVVLVVWGGEESS